MTHLWMIWSVNFKEVDELPLGKNKLLLDEDVTGVKDAELGDDELPLPVCDIESSDDTRFGCCFKVLICFLKIFDKL